MEAFINSKPKNIHSEILQDGWGALYEFGETYFEGESDFQTVKVVDLGPFGRTLLLDGHVQSSEVDERAYHEALVQPAMMLHPCPKRVFIGGGGEGATLREVLKHKSVEEVVMVDIDGVCVDFCKKHLPNHHRGSFDNKRAKVVIGDALEYMKNSAPGSFDVIIYDLCDPTEGGPAHLLYTENFYRMSKERLTPGGILITQSGPGGFMTCRDVMTHVAKTLSGVFTTVLPYITNIPSFSDEWSWVLATDAPCDAPGTFLAPTIESFDARINERLEGGSSALDFYDAQAHAHMFNLPKNLRRWIADETEIYTEDTKHFLHAGK